MKIPRSNKLQSVPPGLSREVGAALANQRARTFEALLVLEDMEAQLVAARQRAEDRYATYEAMLAEVDGQLKLDLSGMSWSCMVCGAMRPDEFIAVAYRPIEGAEHIFPGGGRVNVRYCKDNEDCSAQANAEGPWRWRK